MANVKMTKRRSRFQRAKMAARLGIEFMDVRQTARGWRQPNEPFRRRRTWDIVGRGWLMYGVFAHTQMKKKWFQRWFPTLDAAKAYAKKRGWWLHVPVEKLQWTKDEQGRSKVERVQILMTGGA